MNNTAKRILAAATSVIMCLSLMAGCKGDTTSGGNSAAPNGSEGTSEAGTQQVADNGWDYGQVSVGGGGFVTGVFATCEKDVYYARTDVGGAYRWDEAKQQWKSLNYWVSEDDVGLMGISALAVDPTNAANVYLLAGTEYFSGGKTCLLKSTDYGATFTVVDLTSMIKVHGNCMGRGNGERLAVDPNNPSILFAGGNTGGMLKSTDAGLTWEPVSSFPVTHTANQNGINIIMFDPDSKKGGASQTIYAGVSQAEDSFYVSNDAGATWNVVEGSIDAMPQRMKLDSEGNVYVVYGDKEGPWNQSKGSVYKYDIDAGTAEDIAPAATPFGDIVIDPKDNNRMVLVTTQTWSQQPNGSFGDIFYTTTDGGKTWTNILSNITMSNNGMNWIEGCAIHWCCSLAMNPNNSSSIMVTSGNGIFRCDNIWDANPEFYFNAKGIEETVPMDVVTIEGNPLVSAALDYDGFVHESIFSSAARHGDLIGSTTSITVAAQNTSHMAKTGGSDTEQMVTYTTDKGETWTRIKAKPVKGETYHSGTVAFNADGSRLIWSPSNSFYSYYTEDFESWTQCEGIMGQNMYILGDNINPDIVYACGGEKLYVSKDGGKSFEKIGNELFLTQRRFCVSPDTEGMFYVPAINLYMTKDYGATFEKVNGVKSCQAVSLGKAKNEGDPYVIYIYGTVQTNDAVGIYMSEDNGATWERCNDDAHRFGGMGNGGLISGDLNVYGRVYMSTVGLGICYCDKREK